MSAANCTPFPVYGQAFRLRITFYVAGTNLPVSGTLTALAATICKDDGSSISTTNAPVQSGTVGTCYIDLTAAEMTCYGCTVYATCSNASSYSKVKEIAPLNLQPGNGQSLGSNTWWEQAILRFERIAVEISAYQYNQNNVVAGAQEVYNTDGTPLAAGVLAANQQGTMRGQLS